MISKTMMNAEAEKEIIGLGPNHRLTLMNIKHLCQRNVHIKLDKSGYEAMESSYAFLKNHVDKRIPIYGLNTQFGDQVSLLDVHINNDDITCYHESVRDRQENLIKSHACGMGDFLPFETVKTAMLLRANCLSQGYSGVSPKTVEHLLLFLNAGIIPCVPRYGSIGASGDLIPLATIAAALIGEGQVQYENTIMTASKALELTGISKFQPEMRDGLALINGTSLMTAITGVAVYNLQRLFKQVLSTMAMILESLMIIDSAYNPLVHTVKRQTGQKTINQFFVEFWKGSQLLSDLDEVREKINTEEDHKVRKTVQDYYSLRSIPQGFGPFQENLDRAIVWVENEMNSVNDNPIIDIAHAKILHGANFMGYYITDTCDILKMNIAQASTWLHALLAILVHPRKNHDLPTNLVENPERHNGFRPLQLLAASLAVQNRKLAQSHQAYTLPTEGDNQDVNSLGTHAALDLRDAVMNLENLTAVLLLAAVQALEFRDIKKASKRSQEIYEIVRKHSQKMKDCRVMQEELKNIVSLLQQEIEVI